MNAEQFVGSIVSYFRTRIRPWESDESMKEAVRETVNLMLGPAAYDTVRLLPEWSIRDWMGNADWKYDHELGCHIPCCSVVKSDGKACGNGPLDPAQIPYGYCGEAHAPLVDDPF